MRTLVLSVALFLVVAMPACPGPGPGPIPVITTAIVDCTAENQASIGATYEELKGQLQSKLILGEPFDWPAAGRRALQAGKNIGICTLGKLVQWYLGGRVGGTTEDSWKARGVFEDYRATHLGGATVKIEIDGKIVEL